MAELPEVLRRVGQLLESTADRGQELASALGQPRRQGMRRMKVTRDPADGHPVPKRSI